MNRRPPRSPLSPYTTLFRSKDLHREGRDDERPADHVKGRAARLAAGCVLDPVLVAEVRDAHERDHQRDQDDRVRSEEHTSELQSRQYLVCRLLLEKKIIIIT